MNTTPTTKPLQLNQMQQQQTQQHNLKQLLTWLSTQIQKKNLPQITSSNQLSSGTIFLEIVSIYYPKKVDLTKTFINPKDEYQVLQNFKQLAYAFGKLGWKKFDPEKFRKRKEKELVAMAQYLKKLLSGHLFDATQNGAVHSLLTTYPNPDKPEESKEKEKNDFIKIEDRKNVKLSRQNQIQKPRQSEMMIRKKSENIITKTSQKNSSSKQGFPPKPTQILTTQRLSKQSTLSPKIPPHPHSSTKNITTATSKVKNEEEQLNSFQNMRITKLEKQKQFLMRKILQIQQLVAQQKNQLTRNNLETKILDQVNQDHMQSKNTGKQQENIQRVKRTILDILKDVQL